MPLPGSTRLLDHRVFRMIMLPARTTLRLTSIAAQAFLRTVAKVVGSEVVDDVVAFFRAFEGMEDGFRVRAEQVRSLMSGPSTAFVLITSPRRDAVDEADYFATRLSLSGLRVEALVVNRVHPRFTMQRSDDVRARATSLARSAPPLAAAYGNLADLTQVTEREEHQLAELAERLPDAEVARVPELDFDVHTLAALHVVAAHLVGTVSPSEGAARSDG